MQLDITFEAHYWGRFQLTAMPDTWDLYGQIPYPIARSIGYGPRVSLMYDPPSQNIFLSNQPHRPIASSAEAFFDLEKIQNVIPDHPLYFDRREKLEDLLSPAEYSTTEINDPEHFESVAAYLELIPIFEQLSNGDLFFTQKTGKQISPFQKEIMLGSEMKNKFITLDKELFDNQFIISLNEILVEKGIQNYCFAMTINPEMYLVLLKLSPAKFKLLEQMGLLV
jgi:hypothetical protein